MHPARFEPEIPANMQPQTYGLDRAAIGIGLCGVCAVKYQQHYAFLNL
jgi:hypothetical protein